MKDYKILAWVTIGGSVVVSANSPEEAEQLVNDMIEQNETDFINHDSFNCSNREFETLGEVT